MKKQLLEVYTDYLMSSFSYTKATGLSVMSEGKISQGVNIVLAMYYSNGYRIPVTFDIVRKTKL